MGLFGILLLFFKVESFNNKSLCTYGKLQTIVESTIVKSFSSFKCLHIPKELRSFLLRTTPLVALCLSPPILKLPSSKSFKQVPTIWSLMIPIVCGKLIFFVVSQPWVIMRKLKTTFESNSFELFDIYLLASSLLNGRNLQSWYFRKETKNLYNESHSSIRH